MPRTITYTQTTYQFDELDETAKERALEIFRELEGNNFDLVQDFVWEMFYEGELEPFGVHSAEYRYTGFWSQGDGASFTGTIDLTEWIRKTGNYNTFRKVYKAAQDEYENVSVSAHIERINPHYYHENSVQAVIEVEDWEFGRASEHMNEQVNACEDALNEWVRAKSQELYKALEDEYEYRVSDECLVDLIEANEYEFDRHGNFPPQVFDRAEEQVA